MREENLMLKLSKQILRENFLGLSLTLLGVLCLVLAAMVYGGGQHSPRFVSAETAGLDGPDIEALERQNKAYERIAQAVTPDRKSTRLNSSHGYISYAVFCLKKKKKADGAARSRAHLPTNP